MSPWREGAGRRTRRVTGRCTGPGSHGLEDATVAPKRERKRLL